MKILSAGIKAFIALLMLIPLYLMVTNAFKTEKDIREMPFGFPSEGFTTENVVTALTANDYSIVKACGVSIFLVVVVNAIAVAITAPAAYAIARGTRVAHKIVMLVMMAGLFIPSQVIMIPVIFVLRAIGLMGTLPGLILFQVTGTIPASLFLYISSISMLPRQLDEAAKIDGASRMRTFWKIIFPLMKPAVVTALVLNFINVWCDYISPRILLSGSGLTTITTGVYSAISVNITEFTAVYSNVLLATIPVFVFYVAMQKHIVSGLMAGAVKG
jgi:raffinose/stachyose/melibiose transport system permease protein